ncbi:MAG: phage tail tape measure protein [Bacillota bacterium]|nr:phage tail tape measure protein [Bacillota bacterium]
MADDLQRVGLVFKADGTVDFRKSLKAVSASIQENRTEFKLAKSTWDESTKAVDKLKASQTYLEKQTQDYSMKVRVLRDELGNLENAEKRDEAAIQKKRAELNTAETSLNNYKRGLEEVNDKLKSGAAQIEEFAGKVEKLGSKMTDAGKKMTVGVTTPIVGIGAAGVKAAMELDEGYDTIIAKTGATGDTLQGLNDVADRVFGSMPVEMQDVGTAVGEINTRFGSTGDELEGLTKKFLQFAEINGTDVNNSIRLVSRAMGDAGIPTEQTGELLDKLTIAGQASGVEIEKLTENLAKYGAPMRALGLTTDESIAIFAGWEKAGVNTEIAFSGMKKAIGTWGKEGKNATEEFKKTLKAIESAPDIATATSMAIEVFGQKAGPDLADAIKGGRFEYQDFLQLIQDSTGIVSQTFEEQQDPWDQWKTTVNELKLAGAELGGVLIETLAPILQEVAGKVKEFSEWFRNLDENQQRTIVTIGLVIAAIGPLLVVFGSVFGGISKIIGGSKSLIGLIVKGGPKVIDVFKLVGSGAKGLWAILAANPIGAVITVIGILISAFVAAYNKCEWFRNGVDKIFKEVVEFFKDVGKKFKETGEDIVDFFKGLGKKIGDFFSFKWLDIKLPHLKISGDFSLVPPRVPKISVKWYAKGGILNKPTLFGQNGGELMGGGEAGPEAVLPIKLLREYIREENKINNESLVAAFIEALKTLNISPDVNVYIGDGKLTKVLAGEVIKIIGNGQKERMRAMGLA